MTQQRVASQQKKLLAMLRPARWSTEGLEAFAMEVRARLKTNHDVELGVRMIFRTSVVEEKVHKCVDARTRPGERNN